MAVPKHKVSKQAGNSRYANWKLQMPGMSECPHCHEMKLNHRVCKHCGYYGNKLVVEQKTKKASE